MSEQELHDMRSYIDEISNPDAVLYMWSTGPMLPAAIRVMSTWMFHFKTVAFTWIKTNKHPIKSLDPCETAYLIAEIDDGNKINTTGDFMGMGSHSRSNGEFVLLGVRGKGIKRVSASVRSTVIAPVREHSRKPDEVRRRIENLYGDVPRIELFARERFPENQ
jgi:site-specific DNA-methyltransferase (adenine-specific)